MSQKIKFEYLRSIADMLPPYYRDYLESERHIEASDGEFARLYATLSDVVNNFFILNASWALDYYEDIYGLPTLPGETDEARRKRIVAALSGAGTSTVKNLEHMINELVGVIDAHITEHNEEYYFDVTLPILADVVPITEVDRLLGIYKPAHLGHRITSVMTDRLYLATIQLTGEETTVYPYHADNIELTTKQRQGTGLYTQEIIEIKTEGY